MPLPCILMAFAGCATVATPLLAVDYPSWDLARLKADASSRRSCLNDTLL